MNQKLSAVKQILTFCVVLFTFFLFIPTFIIAADTGDTLFGGTAKTNITPEKPVTLAGYSNRTGLSQGIHDPISARVVVFEQNGNKLVLVSTDILGYYDGTADIFRKAIISRFNLKPSELFLTAIHTHSAPSITLDTEKGHVNNLEYVKKLQDKLIGVIGRAFENKQPVQIGTGSGSSPVGANRRAVLYDENGNPRTRLGRNPYGVTDKEVQVLKMINGNEQLQAVLFDYATHSTSLGKNYLISGDVHGLAEQFLEKFFGDNVIAPAFAGASGNIDPWYRILRSFETKNGWIPEPVLLGTLLGTEVVHVLNAIENFSSTGPVKSAFETVELPGKPRGELKTTADQPPTPLNISVARIGDIAFVGLGGEVLCEIGMDIKKASPFEQTIVMTHCNGTAGYLPPKHLYIEGGYEITSSPFASSAAEMVIKKAVKMLNQL